MQSSEEINFRDRYQKNQKIEDKGTFGYLFYALNLLYCVFFISSLFYLSYLTVPGNQNQNIICVSIAAYSVSGLIISWIADNIAKNKISKISIFFRWLFFILNVPVLALMISCFIIKQEAVK